MITAYLNGGLGNQMFQYACGRTLADRLGVAYGLDKRYFDGKPLFGYGLDHFAIRHDPVTEDELPPDRHFSPLRHLLWRAIRHKPLLFREKGLGYNTRWESLGDGVYLKGYWQSERYFSGNAERIRRDFAFLQPAAGRNAQMLSEITALPAVSLHIRRGDYVADAATNATHGTPALDYHERAARHIAEASATSPVIFIFSDDPEWVRENLKLPFEMRFVDHNDSASGHEDLRLMSACRHHIIANSSFSWWGAWLNPSPDKIVVAPERWFAHPKLHNPDIIPDGWLRM